MVTDLYHNRVLELAADIPNLEPLTTPDGQAHKVSRVCGSEVTVELNIEDDIVSDICVDSKACALGAASLSVLSREAKGASLDEIRAARDALRAMLKEKAEPPKGRFWELRHLQGVADYPQRHQSILLAFDAAVAAIEDALEKRLAKASS